MKLPYKPKALPQNWCEVTLNDIANWGSGGTPKSGFKEYYDGDIPWLIIGDLNDGYVSDSQKKITPLGLSSSSAHIVPPNSVLVAMYGSIGKLGINLIPVATNQAIAFTSFLPFGLQNFYLFYYLLCIRPSLHSVGKGGTQKNISQTVLKVVPFPLPPLNEQKRIVGKIEELFSELDAGVASLRQARAQLGVYRQSLLKQAFEGKLTEKWRAENPDQIEPAEKLLERIRQEREARYQQQLTDWQTAVKEWEANGKEGKKPAKPRATKQPDPLTEEEILTLGELPRGWSWEKNERYLFEVKDGTHDTPKYFENGIPFITQKNIKNDGLVFDSVQYIGRKDHEKFYARSNVANGDLLISMIGHSRGNCCLVKTDRVFSIKNVGLFKFFEGLQSNVFLKFYYQSTGGLNLVLKKSKGGAQPFIGLTELRNWPVPLCSLPEQKEIVRILEAQFEAIEQNEREIDAALERSEALRQSILKKAFSGQLVPQDPNDEPASVLLERIRAERAAAELERKPKKKAAKKRAVKKGASA